MIKTSLLFFIKILKEIHFVPKAILSLNRKIGTFLSKTNAFQLNGNLGSKKRNIALNAAGKSSYEKT